MVKTQSLFGPGTSAKSGGLGRHGVRLRTLIGLRWISVAGQGVAVLAASLLLHVRLPLIGCVLVVAGSAWINFLLQASVRRRRQAGDWEAAAQLGFDVAQLTLLLGLTGGLVNPFSLMLIAPVVVAASTLPRNQALTLWVLGVAGSSALLPLPPVLPWLNGATVALPGLDRAVAWVAVVSGQTFIAYFAWRAADEASRMEVALTATQVVLAREQRLAALGGLAAAAAHELGTPLATIQVVAKELLRSSPADDPVAEDARLLMQQAQRCRDILSRLSQKPETGDVVYARLGLAQLLEEVTEPYEHIGPKITVKVEGRPGEFVPEVKRLPEVVHALSAFVENAADFAASEVKVTARFDGDRIAVEVLDDGPGFSPDIVAKLGEPYVTSRPSAEGSRSHHQGMGLGFFIAKTLLERTGGEVSFGNERRGGALIAVQWRRDLLEAERDS